MRTLLNVLFVAMVAALYVGCGEKGVKPTLVGSWQLEGVCYAGNDFIPLADDRKECYTFIVGTEGCYDAFRCGYGKASANQIRLFFYMDSIRIGSTKIYEEIDDAIMFMNLYAKINRYELRQNKLKLFSADSANNYLLYHKISE